MSLKSLREGDVPLCRHLRETHGRPVAIASLQPETGTALKPIGACLCASCANEVHRTLRDVFSRVGAKT